MLFSAKKTKAKAIQREPANFSIYKRSIETPTHTHTANRWVHLGALQSSYLHHPKPLCKVREADLKTGNSEKKNRSEGANKKCPLFFEVSCSSFPYPAPPPHPSSPRQSLTTRDCGGYYKNNKKTEHFFSVRYLFFSIDHRSPPITTDHHRSPPITTDHHRSPPITTDHHRPRPASISLISILLHRDNKKCVIFAVPSPCFVVV